MVTHQHHASCCSVYKYNTMEISNYLVFPDPESDHNLEDGGATVVQTIVT